MKYLFTTVLLFLTLQCYSQNQATANNKTNNTVSSEQKIYEVYGSQFFVGKQSLFQFYNNLLDHRISYKLQPPVPNEKYPTVQSMGLQNKNNTTISHPTVFDQNSFNPLYYKLDFFAKTTKKYRIDNSNYLLVISPQ